MTLDGRLLVNSFVLREFDHEVDEVVRAVFTREMAASPSKAGLLGFEASGSVVAARLDALGYTADRALDLLDDSLDLARSAYEAMHPEDYAARTADPASGPPALDAEGWMQVFAEGRPSPSQLYVQWFLGLLQDHDAGTVLRLAALARPQKTMRLEVPPDMSFTPTLMRRQLVITQTAEDADALRFAVQGRTPHLTDLMLVSHLGGDGSPQSLVDHVRGLERLQLIQPLTAVFRPDGVVDAMLLEERSGTFRVLVAPAVPLLDPPATLEALLALIGIGVAPDLPRRRGCAGGSGTVPAPSGIWPRAE